jgi:(p)ppGpp synthase/HD superfamily hydrolase
MTTARLAGAMQYAANAHDGQLRKGTTIPYIAHPLAVCALVLEHDGKEDEAIAALLHDVAEDTRDGDGRARLNEIGALFGARVAQIVELCSDTIVKPKPSWIERKAAYLGRLRLHATGWNADPGYLRVSCADKLHNARATIADVRRYGMSVFDRFNAPTVEHTLHYYEDLAIVFTSNPSTDDGIRTLTADLADAVIELRTTVISTR